MLTRSASHLLDVVDGYRVDDFLAGINESGEKRLHVDVRWRY